MARIYLYTKDKKQPRGDWELLLGKGRARLTDPHGEVAADFDIDEAEKRFTLPSFWRSVAKIGIKDDRKKVIWFEKDREALREITRYLAYTLAMQGEGAISAARWKGWGMVIGGILLLLVGIGVMILSLAVEVNSAPQSRRPIIWGWVMAIIGGGSLIGLGATALNRANVAEMEWGEEEEE